MFFRHLDFVFAPFRAVYNKFLSVRNIKGNIQVDMNRGKAMVGRGKGMAQHASTFRPIGGDSVGGYAELFDRSTLDEVEALAGDALSTFGYQ